MQFHYKNVALLLQRSDIMGCLPDGGRVQLGLCCYGNAKKLRDKSSLVIDGKQVSRHFSGNFQHLHIWHTAAVTSHFVISHRSALSLLISTAETKCQSLSPLLQEENNHTKLGAILGHRNCSFSWTPAAPAHFCLVWLTGCRLWLNFKLQK